MEENGRSFDHNPLLAQIDFSKPAVPGEQEADSDYLGGMAVITASEKDLLIDFPAADITYHFHSPKPSAIGGRSRTRLQSGIGSR